MGPPLVPRPSSLKHSPWPSPVEAETPSSSPAGAVVLTVVPSPPDSLAEGAASGAVVADPPLNTLSSSPLGAVDGEKALGIGVGSSSASEGVRAGEGVGSGVGLGSAVGSAEAAGCDDPEPSFGVGVSSTSPGVGDTVSSPVLNIGFAVGGTLLLPGDGVGSVPLEPASIGDDVSLSAPDVNEVGANVGTVTREGDGAVDPFCCSRRDFGVFFAVPAVFPTTESFCAQKYDKRGHVHLQYVQVFNAISRGKQRIYAVLDLYCKINTYELLDKPYDVKPACSICGMYASMHTCSCTMVTCRP